MLNNFTCLVLKVMLGLAIAASHHHHDNYDDDANDDKADADDEANEHRLGDILDSSDGNIALQIMYFSSFL